MSEINIDSVDLNLIRLFVAVYEEKSATRAGLRIKLNLRFLFH